jgi:WD40 repeat protein
MLFWLINHFEVGANKKLVISNRSGEVVQSIEALAGYNDCCWIAENLIVAASDDGTVRVYDIVKAKALATYRTIKAFPYTLDINRSNNSIVVGDTDGWVSTVHVSCKDFVNRFMAHASTVTSVRYNHEYNEITTSSYDGTSRQWIPIQKPLCLRSIIPNPKQMTPL